jgi:hypothetical protein
VVEAEHRRPAQLRRGDRQHARAAAEVHQRAAQLELEQQLQAQARRRVRAGAEGLRGVDDDVERAFLGRRPRRADAQAAHAHRLVERLPALVPVVRQLARGDLDERSAGGGLQLWQRRQLAGRAVHRVLDDVAVVALLDPAGRQLEQLGQHELGLLAPYANREADHARPPRIIRAGA